MKKVYNPTDLQQKEGQELSKKLYRTISEQAKRLDDARSCVRNIADLFTPLLQSQRRKFCEYCERLIFSEPLLFGRKGEELLWRKGFYEVVSTAKKLKKKEFSDQEVSNIQAHIYSGIGFYHHMLSKLQWQFKIQLTNIVDCDMILDGKNDSSDVSPELKEWAKQSIHQCLIYLGDLCRYKLELKPNSEQILAARYYLQAVSYKSDYGMPHNQMGTLAMNQNNYLDAVYHYLRCLACKIPFEGTANNLHNLFDKNSKFIEQLPNIDNEGADCIIEPGRAENIKCFIARFLLLIDIWYFNKKVPKVYSLCHQTYKNLEECLAYNKPTSSESGESPTTEIDILDAEPTYLSSQMIFRVIVICLLTISKLQSTNSPQLSTLVAFTLSIYLQIVQSITNHIQEAVLNYPLSEENRKANGILKDLVNGGKKKSKTKARRRKVLKVESDDDSDGSENDAADFSSSDEDSFISDSEDVLAESSDEEIDIIKVSDESFSEKFKENGFPTSEETPTKNKSPKQNKNKDFVLKKVQKMDVNVMLEIINEEGLLQSIKIVNDWLKSDQEIIKSCGINTRTLIRQMVYLINLININLNNGRVLKSKIKISEIIANESKIPLSEDVVLKGIDLFKAAQSEYTWDFLLRKGITAQDEAIIRIIKILSFAKVLSKIQETGVSYNEEKNVFICPSDDKSEDDTVSAAAIMEELERQELNSTPSKTSLVNGETKPGAASGNQISKMKHMGQLWLAAEVRALETRLGGAKATLSPYLVLDADALIKYTHMVKQLVHSRKFIVLVPAAVVSALDDLKKEKIEARDAIRWLESQFHRGNRFFRAQRQQERTPIPFIKYPKKKDKDMQICIQIIECCHYFADQQKGASNVVTLLIGTNQSLFTNGENKDFSYAGLAQSVGIVIEPITSFYGKWKKSKGNR